MGLFDKILGPDVRPGLFSTPPIRPPLSRTEQQVANVLPGVLASAAYEIPGPSISEGNPFTEVRVPYVSIPPGGYAGVVPPTSIVPIALRGERLTLMRSGTSPDCKLVVNIGGQLSMLVPGQEVVAHFDQFEVVKRLHWIPSDAAAGGTWVSAAQFYGEARFIVSKLAGAQYNEPNSGYDGTPWFRPIAILGNVAKDAVNWGNLVSGGTLLPLCRAGCRRLRILLSKSPWPNAAPAGTIAASDVVDVRFWEVALTYDETGSVSTALTRNCYRGDLLATVTWGGQDIYELIVDLKPGDSDYFIVEPVQSALAHTFYFVVQGIA